MDHLSLSPGEHNRRCPYHNGRCAYDADDPTRCPLCHASWSVIALDEAHCCEDSTTWHGDRVRVEFAREMREQALGSLPLHQKTLSEAI